MPHTVQCLNLNQNVKVLDSATKFTKAGGRDVRLLSMYQRNVSDIHATDTFLLCSVVRKKKKNLKKQQELAYKRGGCSV